MEHLATKDVSRLSTGTIAPFILHMMTDTTFVSILRKKLKTGKMNLNEIGFHFMWILLLKLPEILWSRLERLQSRSRKICKPLKMAKVGWIFNNILLQKPQDGQDSHSGG